MDVRTVIRTIVSRFLLLLVMLIGAVPILIFLLLPKRWLHDSKAFYWFTYTFYRLMIKASFLSITYKGAEHVPDGPVIFAANHQSSLDIPLLGVLTKGEPHIWLAKKELMDSPILRIVLPLMSVLIDMSSPLAGMRSLKQVMDMVYEKKRHAMIFPEGGRYTDGTVHDFYGGFVILAKKTGRPVVPVRIFGVHKVYPPDTFWVQKYPITVVVGKPLVYQEGDTDEAFKNRVYQWFIEQKES